MAFPLSPRRARPVSYKGVASSAASRLGAAVARASGAVLALVALLGMQMAFAPALMAASLAPQTPQAARALSAAKTARQQTPHADSAGQVTIIVLDMSGSMATNDPDGLRCSAASAYIALSGVGDYVGVVGLDNSDNSSGGPHNFPLAQTWAQPTDMATLAARTRLQATINSDSGNCKPDANTPTYDALDRAYSMLMAATSGNGRSGSVILLTDGQPTGPTATSGSEQISAIQSELLPKFQAANFPIDTIALGVDDPSQPFFAFLQGLSTATSGNFYNDSQGPISGTPNALNIAPFFVDIFALRNHRTLGPTVPPTALSGGTDAQDLTVPSYVQHLDVIVVKDQPATTVTLTAPSGQAVPPAVAGVFIANDPHYAIFSIDGGSAGVAAGVWTVGVTGSGNYLVDSLVKSTLTLGITQPASSVSALPLGQPFAISAQLTSNGQLVVGSQYTISGTLTSNGLTSAGAPYSVGLSLSQVSPGVYQVMVNVPVTAPAGTYRISLNVTQVSGFAVSGADLNIRLELFPTPLLLTGRPAIPTTQSVNSTVTAWDPGLQFIYSIPVISWLSGWPLGHLPARPSADLNGEVTSPSGQLYPNATVIGVATRDGTNKSVNVQITNDAAGHFAVVFPAPVSGDYTITFHTRGSFSDTHGDFGVTLRKVHLVVQPATTQQEVFAWVITALYALLAWLTFYFFVPRLLAARPHGTWQRSPVGPDGGEGSGSFDRARQRSAWRWFFHPNWRTSREAFGDNPGVVLVFSRNSVAARSDGRGASIWRLENGDALTSRLVPTNGLRNDQNMYTFSMDAETGGRRGRSAAASSWDSGSSTAGWGEAPTTSNARAGRGGRGGRRRRDAAADDWGGWQ